MSRQHTTKLLIILVSFGVLSVPLWLKVDSLPLRIWDEARNAVNAVEMYESGNYLIRTFDYEPETYNLKPPLLTWLQVIGIHFFGYTELAIRLPSVLASLGSMLFIFLIVYRSTRNLAFGLLGAAIAVTSFGFYGRHVGRFGDHDALLVLFCTWLIYLFLEYLKDPKSTRLYGIALVTCAGILTKSIAIMVLFPGLLACLILSGHLKTTLTNKHFYLALLAGLFPLVVYYGLREVQQPGYLSLVWNDELFPRYINKSDNLQFRDEGFWYYFNLIRTEQFRFWVYLLPALIFPLVFKTTIRKTYLNLLLIGGFFMVIISLGTKNFWYDAPIFPILASLLSISLFVVFNQVTKNIVIQAIAVLGLAYYPYSKAHQWSVLPTERYYEWEANGISYFLKNDRLRNQITHNTQILLDLDYGLEPHIFYVRKLKKETGIDLERVRIYNIQSGDTLLITYKSTQDTLSTNYHLHTIDSLNENTKLIHIERKTP